MSTQTILTEAEFDALDRADGAKYELSEGEVIVTAAPRAFHNLVRQYLSDSLSPFCRIKQLGAVLSETEFRLDSNTIRIPDLAFIRAERMRTLNLNERIESAPDWAAEVVSPSNDASELALLVEQYLRAGTDEVWVLYPRTGFAYIHRSGERVEVRTDGQLLDAPTLFPGWSLPLTDLFNAGRP